MIYIYIDIYKNMTTPILPLSGHAARARRGAPRAARLARGAELRGAELRRSDVPWRKSGDHR